MKASKAQITFYKSKVLEPINKEIDRRIKHIAGLDEKSCSEMTKDEMKELIIAGFQVGDILGLKLNYPDNDADFIREL